MNQQHGCSLLVEVSGCIGRAKVAKIERSIAERFDHHGRIGGDENFYLPGEFFGKISFEKFKRPLKIPKSTWFFRWI